MELSRSYASSTVLFSLVAFRVANALCVRTFFQPDEYFQALEPAWRIAFGPDSGAWLTWEWQYQLRSSLHPALFGSVYILLHNVLGLFHASPQLTAAVLVAAPKAVQAIFAALGDYYTWKLAQEIYGSSSNVPTVALCLTVLNPWQWYCSTRTFSNSIENTLTVMALYHWPWRLLGSADKAEGASKSLSVQSLKESLLLAAVAVILRPTNILIWTAILTLTITRLTLDGKSPLTLSSLIHIFINIALCGSTVLAISLLSDRFYFGFWTFPPYAWLHFNISQSLSVFYGRNDWHYYLSQGIPLLATTCLPFVLIGLWKSTGSSPPLGLNTTQSNTTKTLSFAVLALVGALSTISHKEVRFIYPLLPVLHVLAAPHVLSFFTTDQPTQPGSKSPARRRLRHRGFLAISLTINVILGGYLSLLHQPAPISVLNFLRHEYERLHPDKLSLTPGTRSYTAPLAPTGVTGPDPTAGQPDDLFALFLTPCHSTPWRSHLVYPALRARALTCEPPLHTQPGTRERAEYLDEADRFYADAQGFLARDLWPATASAGHTRPGLLPRYVVGFEGIEPELLRFFEQSDVELRRVWEGWNGFFNEDSRRRGLLVVWETARSD